LATELEVAEIVVDAVVDPSDTTADEIVVEVTPVNLWTWMHFAVLATLRVAVTACALIVAVTLHAKTYRTVPALAVDDAAANVFAVATQVFPAGSATVIVGVLVLLLSAATTQNRKSPMAAVTAAVATVVPDEFEVPT
jgi:hypothetical protein